MVTFVRIFTNILEEIIILNNLYIVVFKKLHEQEGGATAHKISFDLDYVCFPTFASADFNFLVFLIQSFYSLIMFA